MWSFIYYKCCWISFWLIICQEANSTRIQTNVELNEQLKRQRKINTELAKEKLGLISAYQKESQRLNDLRNKYKNVALTQGENSKAARLLAKEVTKLDTKLKRIDAAVGQFQRNVGNYSKAFRGLSNILAAGGLTLGVAGFFRVIKNGLGILKNFEKTNAELAGVLDLPITQISSLKDNAVKST